ncbi:hypothetical protein IDG49_01065 [Pelagibacterales bacterium SAG-MED07]|nr:hypothetical protein [Pelagibacterales bacterium SAG-MED07]
MIKTLKNILIFFYLILFFTTSVYSKDISTLLRTQQLTVFDIGIFRLEEDLKSSYPVIKKHKDVPYEDIYMDVVSSYWKNTVDLIVSIPVNENLKKENYMSDSFRCRNIFNSVRDHLLKNENLSNYRFTMATSYLTSVFSTPSTWPRWRYDQSVLEELVNLVKLEVILRPTTELAFKDKVNPVSCKGGLETENEEIIVSMKYN